MIGNILVISTAIIFFIYHLPLNADIYSNPQREPTYLILNMDDQPVLPRNFRTSTTILSDDNDSGPSLEGLGNLNISGSAQFSKNSLQKIFENIPSDNITIIDLRAEPHAILNGMAITWYSKNNWTNDGLTPNEINEDQQLRISQLLGQTTISIYKNKHRENKFSVPLETIESEEETAQQLGFGYLRIHSRDHSRPSDDAVDKFVEFVKSLDSDAWLHFHCSAGRGRTTTFMALYDLMRNADRVSVEDVVERQKLIGGLDLFEIPNEGDWKHPLVLERAKLIQDFHRYCLENPDFSITWSEWLQNNRMDNIGIGMPTNVNQQ